MKYLCLTTILLFCLFTTSTFTQENTFLKEYLERLENSRKYVIAVAELMPERDYNFKAADGSLSFAQNLLHIGYAMDWHSQSLLGDRKARVWQTDNVFKVANKSKKEMIDLINKTFNEVFDFITNFDTNKLNDKLDYFGLNRSKRQILMLLADHITHHRGQMLVYLRLKGITPPRYVLYQ